MEEGRYRVRDAFLHRCESLLTLGRVADVDPEHCLISSGSKLPTPTLAGTVIELNISSYGSAWLWSQTGN